jgi:hypothetical protein
MTTASVFGCRRRAQRDSLPRSERGSQGVRHSTPWLDDDEKLRGLGADIERLT